MFQNKDGDEEVRTMQCTLNSEEILARHGEIVRMLGDRDETDAELKDIGKTLRAKIKSLNLQISDLVTEVREKSEWRDVTCVWRRDEIEGTMTLTRTDTGEVGFTRPLTAEEKQLSMFRGGANEEARAE